MLNVVIVGAGLMGYHHAFAARRAGARVAGVIDPNIESAERLSKRLGGVRTAASLDTMIAAERFDIAHVCSPVATHMLVARALAEAGIHALIEKPLTETADETEQLAAAFAKSATLFCPVHQYAFQRGVEAAIGHIAQTRPLTNITFDIASAGGGRDTAQFDRIAGEILPHPLSMLQRLLPGIVLDAVPWQVVQGMPGEWLVTAVHDSVVIAISLSLASRPTRFLTRVSGVHGTVELDNFHGYALRLSDTVSKTAKITGPFSRAAGHFATASSNLAARTFRGESAYPGLRQIVSQFYSAVEARDATLLPVAAAQAIDCARARDHILLLVSKA